MATKKAKAKTKKGSTKRARQYKCGSCQELGHNARTCGR